MKSKTNLDLLDVIRGVAVTGVVFVHTAAFAIGAHSESPVLERLQELFNSGRFGVELFFLLSGFLIAWVYGNSEKSNSAFLIARFFRIWPLWFLFACVWAVIGLTEHVLSASEAGLAVALSSVFALWTSPVFYDAFIGGAWSIQIEVFSYLVFAMARKWSTKHLLMLAVGINVLGALASFWSLDGFGIVESLRRLTFQTGFNFFLFGWLIARYLPRYLDRKNLQLLRNVQIPKLWLSMWLVSFLITPAIYGSPIQALGAVAIYLGASLLILRAKYFSRLFIWLGNHSYFIFFAHFVILHFAAMLAPNLSQVNPLLSCFLTPFLVVAIILFIAPFAYFSMRFFERPLQKFGRTLGNQIT